MSIHLEVIPLDDTGEISFLGLRLFHSCGPTEIRKHRNPATCSYSLQCRCGLAIEIPDNGVASKEIMFTAIDSQPRTLPRGSYSIVGGEHLGAVLGQLRDRVRAARVGPVVGASIAPSARRPARASRTPTPTTTAPTSRLASTRGGGRSVPPTFPSARCSSATLSQKSGDGRRPSP